MGRSFLSVKLALAFGICVAVVVLVADRATAGTVDSVPAAAEQPVQVRVQTAVQHDTGKEVCLWRGCPIVVPNRYSRAADDAPRRRDRPAQAI